jgi:DNA modification methylase
MILTGDCFELIKTLEDNSVDLVITSPPYADIVNYGKNISIKKPQDYCDWILPLFNEIHRVLKPSGSFILNINDNCSNGLRNPFIYELIYRSQKETNLKFYDTYIWHKKNGIPNGSKKRFRNNTEFIFHFVKNQKELKFYMDRVLMDPKDSYLSRLNSPTNDDSNIVDGERKRKKIDFAEINVKDILIIALSIKSDEFSGLLNDNLKILEEVEEYELCALALKLKNKIDKQNEKVTQKD